ncbi:MAG: hypothetical protein GWN61_22330, partial [candidate division Zixibacteria bacterium]|nr:hypothetical protein [candidate division Zixibacteria bacterium]NIR67208.1 hypothetical protein [candidate division Zixibacteria bacterium]NIS48600.1 hypothetical protein [candidate division Zixibacteria bacterium]NIU16671.1 hypothetical protein [candidate division Zixibacteria bacterium]NIV08840.1 hypothetical protein [candidate division Zixibacteria bacterium]
DSISAIKDAIYHLVGKGNAYKGVNQDLPVSAEVGGRIIIDNEIIKCLFSIQHNKAEVHIMWEDYGYKSYKNLGLFGSMNSEWQYFSTPEFGILEIIDKNGNYKIRIK